MGLFDSIISAIPVVGQVYNAVSQGIQNSKQRDFTQHMYDEQRADALSDYQMQNAYNSPAQQMQRFKAAGLNPNLIYGNAEGATAAPIRSATTTGYKAEAPKVDGSQIVTTYYDMQIKEAQADLLHAQKRNTDADTESKILNMPGYSLGQDTQKLGLEAGRFDLGQRQRLADTNASILEEQRRQLSLRNTGISLENQIMQDKNTRDWIATGQDILSQTQRRRIAEIEAVGKNIANTNDAKQSLILDQQLANLKQQFEQGAKNLTGTEFDNLIKSYEAKLNKAGLTKGDNSVMRWLYQVADRIKNGKPK